MKTTNNPSPTSLEVPAGWECAIVFNQAMADAIIPRVLSKSAKGYMVWIDGITGPVDLTQWLTPLGQDECLNCGAKERRYLSAVDRDAIKYTDNDDALCSQCGHICDVNGYDEEIQWVRVSGGRGDLAVPCHPDWIRDLRDQCAVAGVMFRFDGFGDWISMEDYSPFEHGDSEQYEHRFLYLDGTDHPDSSKPDLPISTFRVGAAASGHLLDGVEHLDSPAGVVVK